MKKQFEKLGVMVDCSRNSVMTPNAVKKLIDILSKLGYNTIKLYTEDTYEIEGEPFFGYMRGRYTKEEIKDIDAYAISKGMELIPCIQTLAHLETIFRWNAYKDIRDTGPVLLVEEEQTYALIEKTFKTLAENFTSRTVNIGMDEAQGLGRGVYENKHGAVPIVDIMTKHLKRVLAIADKYGFTCEMWSDMFMHMAYGDFFTQKYDKSDEVKPKIPQNVRLIYWDYYHKDYEHYESTLDRHLKLTDNVQFAGGAWTWSGFCPNTRFSFATTKPAFEACKARGIKEYCFTMWGDNGGECSPFMVLPVLVAAAEYNKGNYDEESIKRRFKEVVGMDYDAFLALEYPNLPELDQPPRVTSAAKYALYNDPFKGIMDTQMACDKGARFKEIAEELKKYAQNKNWGYIFKSISALSSVCEIKFYLGVRTHELYKNGDKDGLKALADNEYKEVLKRLKIFYNAFENYWMTEKKPHGFDVQDIRLGGLIQRVAHCRKMLLDYVADKLESIPELEETQLEAFHTKESPLYKREINQNYYMKAVTANVL